MVWVEKAECKTCGGEWPEPELADGICCNCQPAYDLGRQSRQDEIVAEVKARATRLENSARDATGILPDQLRYVVKYLLHFADAIEKAQNDD